MSLLVGIKKYFFGTSVDYKKIIQDGAIIIDVRTKQEFKSGNIKGSQNIPLDIISTKIKSLEGNAVILVCHSGIRAKMAKKILVNNDIEAYNAGSWYKIKNILNED